MKGEPPTSLCAACDLQLYSTDKACHSCGIVYCASCYSVKTKLDSSVHKTAVSTSGPCPSCENLIKLKKRSLPSPPNREDSASANTESRFHNNEDLHKSGSSRQYDSGRNSETDTHNLAQQVERQSGGSMQGSYNYGNNAGTGMQGSYHSGNNASSGMQGSYNAGNNAGTGMQGSNNYGNNAGNGMQGSYNYGNAGSNAGTGMQGSYNYGNNAGTGMQVSYNYGNAGSNAGTGMQGSYNYGNAGSNAGTGMQGSYNYGNNAGTGMQGSYNYGIAGSNAGTGMQGSYTYGNAGSNAGTGMQGSYNYDNNAGTGMQGSYCSGSKAGAGLRKSYHSGRKAATTADDDWEDIEEEKYDVRNTDDLLADTPYALLLCGLVKPGDIQSRLSYLTARLKTQEKLNTELKEMNTELKERLAKKEGGKNSGQSYTGKHLFNDVNVGHHTEGSEEEPGSIPARDQTKTGRNPGGILSSSPNHTSNTETGWTDIEGRSASENLEKFDMDSTSRNTAGKSRSFGHDFKSLDQNRVNTDEFKCDNVGLHSSQKKKYNNLTPVRSRENQPNELVPPFGLEQTNQKVKNAFTSSGEGRGVKGKVSLRVQTPVSAVSVASTMTTDMIASKHVKQSQMKDYGASTNEEAALTEITDEESKESEMKSRESYPDCLRELKDSHKDSSGNTKKTELTFEDDNAKIRPETENSTGTPRQKHSDKAHNDFQVSKKSREKPNNVTSKDSGVSTRQVISVASPQHSKSSQHQANSTTRKTRDGMPFDKFCDLEALERQGAAADELDNLHNTPHALSDLQDEGADSAHNDLVSLLFMPSSMTSSENSKEEISSSRPRRLLLIMSPISGSKNDDKSQTYHNKITELPSCEVADEGTHKKQGEKQEHEKSYSSFKSASKNASPSYKTTTNKTVSTSPENKQSGVSKPFKNQVTPNSTKTSSAAVGSVKSSEKKTPLTTSNIPPAHSPADRTTKVQSDKQAPAATQQAPVLKLVKPKRQGSLAEQYHIGFARLKQRQAESKQQKCSSCGRPDCQGENMQSMSRMIKCARENGFQLQDVTPDGNCMFAAVVDQLAMYGDERFTARTLRRDAVRWLEDHPYMECGTPKSEFLSEDWHHYIEKMGRDGEWGDHMILGSIAEVIGCTIRVMSPTSETELHWTTIAPHGEGAMTDDKHLILGHVGEFHYTSLRPADTQVDKRPQTKTATTDTHIPDKQEDTEEERLVCVFREDHVDTLSDLPVAHLSQILKTIIPLALVDDATIYMSEQDGICLDMGSESDMHSIKWIDAVAEGVHVRALDETVCPDSTDIRITNMCAIIRKNMKVISKNRSSVSSGEYVLDELDDKPGYTRVVSRDTTVTMPSPRWAKRNEDASYRGTRNRPIRETLQLPVLECADWPEAATLWKTRQRYQGWPDQDFIQSVVAEGCLLGPLKYGNNLTEWQFCFALVEKRIFREIVSHHQKHVYIMFKTLCRMALIEFDTVSPALKSMFFYACEHIPAEYWETSPGSCVLHLLDQLLKGVQDKHVAHYFIPSQNMFDDLAEAELQSLNQEATLLREQPLLFLRQIQELAMVQYNGDEIIDLIAGDIPCFQHHRSLKRSILDAFVPSLMLIAKENIKAKQYRKGYEILSKAYEERLAVSTCDDSMPYQMFLTASLSGLDLKSMVWFSAYADKNLQGQLSRSLIRELCSDLPLAKIGELLPADVAGVYCDIEVPIEMYGNTGRFCLEFAKFLYQIEKIPAALPVLYHCYNRYQAGERKAIENGDAGTTEGKGEVVPDVEDAVMLEVFVGMGRIYQHQGQLEFFRNLIPEIKLLAERINTTEAYAALTYFCALLKEVELMNSIVQNHSGKVSTNQLNYYYGKISNWPYNRGVVTMPYDQFFSLTSL